LHQTWKAKNETPQTQQMRLFFMEEDE